MVRVKHARACVCDVQLMCTVCVCVLVIAAKCACKNCPPTQERVEIV